MANKSILEMSNIEARNFLLKKEKLFYVTLLNILNYLIYWLVKKYYGDTKYASYKFNTIINPHATKFMTEMILNHTIYINKDGKHTWRPLTIIIHFIHGFG